MKKKHPRKKRGYAATMTERAAGQLAQDVFMRRWQTSGSGNAVRVSGRVSGANTLEIKEAIIRWVNGKRAIYYRSRGEVTRERAALFAAASSTLAVGGEEALFALIGYTPRSFDPLGELRLLLDASAGTTTVAGTSRLCAEAVALLRAEADALRGRVAP